MAKVHECDLCGGRISDDKRAGVFSVCPPLPEELLAYKKDPARLRALSMPEQMALAQKVVAADSAAVTKELCEVCTMYFEKLFTEVLGTKGVRAN